MGLKKHAVFLLGRAARAANRLLDLSVRSVAQSSELETLLEVSCPLEYLLEALLEANVHEVTSDTSAIFSATLTELASTVVASFKFFREPTVFKLDMEDLPRLVEPDSEKEEQQDSDQQGPVAESMKTTEGQRNRVESNLNTSRDRLLK